MASQDFLTATIARRVKGFRLRRGLTAEALADKMAERNVPFPASVVSNLEIGRRRYVTVTELLALAHALDVSPMHLMMPDDLPIDDERVGHFEYAPQWATSPEVARHWIAGHRWVPGQDPNRFADAIPGRDPDEFWRWQLWHRGNVTDLADGASLADELEVTRFFVGAQRYAAGDTVTVVTPGGSVTHTNVRRERGVLPLPDAEESTDGQR